LNILSIQNIQIISLLTVFGLLCGLMLISFAAASAKHFFQSKRAKKRLNRMAGSVMAGSRKVSHYEWLKNYP
jgi:threonine/homoserine/homoserine lactone efflux protein